MVPDGWKLTKLEKLGISGKSPIKAGPFGSSLKKEFYVKSGYKVYGQEQVIAGNLSIGNYYIDSHRFESLKSCAIESGDILISLVGTFGKALVVPKTFEPGIINPRLIRLSLDSSKTDPFFIKEWLVSPATQNLLNDVAHGGTMGVINAKTLKSLPLLLPPLAEQKKIAAILSSVDEAIAKTQAVIDQTRKVKQGLLQQLLTRGIGHTKFKDSVIGKIPEGWNVKTAQDICSLISVGIVIKPSQYYVKSGVPCFRSGNIQEGYIRNDDWVYISEESNEKLSKSKLKTGDVLIVRSGYPGTSCVVTEKFDGANCIDIIFARPIAEIILSEYLSCFINSSLGKKQVLQNQGGLAQQHFNVGAFNLMDIIVPSLEEQTKIVNILSQYQEYILQSEREMVNLVKIKRGLMQDLLTGCIRVTT